MNFEGVFGQDTYAPGKKLYSMITSTSAVYSAPIACCFAKHFCMLFTSLANCDTFITNSSKDQK